MRMISGLAIAAPILLASCAVPEARLRAGLVNAGLSRPTAACMAGEMAGRLSLIQLRRIGDLPYARGERTIPAFLHRMRALRDPEIVRVGTAAAAACAARRLAT